MLASSSRHVLRKVRPRVLTKSMAFARRRASQSTAQSTSQSSASQQRRGLASAAKLGTGAAGLFCLVELANGGLACAPAEGSSAAETKSSEPMKPTSKDSAPDVGKAESPSELLDFKDLGLQIGIGSIAGFSSGYALKKVGKVVAVATGVGFIFLQGLRYYGVIGDIRWDKVEAELVKRVDTDDDGKITTVDLKKHFNSLVKVLGFGLPSSAAFGGAFILGLKRG